MKKYLYLVTMAILVLLPSNILALNNNEYVLVFLNSNPDKPSISEEEIMNLQKGHLDNIGRLVREGHMLSAGPFEGGGGIFIFKTNMQETEKFLETDPAIQADRFKLELFEFILAHGKFCVINEEAEMVNYSFISYRFKIKSQRDLLQKQYDYISSILEEPEILCFGQFKNNSGSFLIFPSEDLPSDFFVNDPLIQEGNVNYTIKKLYIGKGTFCE